MGNATLVLLTLLAFSLTPPSPSYAATLTVCASGCYTTIAAAIAAANAGDTISITDAVHTEAGITVNKTLTIQGQGAANTAVNGNKAGSVFIVNFGVTATIQDMTIQNGSAPAFGGGGILNYGTLTLSNSTLSGNSADAGGGIFNFYGGGATISNSTLSGNSSNFGGGIYNFDGGTAAISNSTLSGNSATYDGGGILNNGRGTVTISNSRLSGNSASGAYYASGGGIFNSGTATISNSTLSDNRATYYGGGIYNNYYGGGTVTIRNTTLSGNSATLYYGGGIYNGGNTVTINNSTLSGNSATIGGGIYNSGTATISNSTLSGNSATYYGGGIYHNGGTTTVKNSIVGNNPGGDCGFAAVNALGANLDTDGRAIGRGTCGSTNFTQVTSAQLNLGPLALNPPGTTATQALLPGSAAIDAVTDCTDVSGNPVTTDQRGVGRHPGESACDIGAFEFVDQEPFASFSAKLSLQFSQGAISLNSAFALGAGINGIALLTEAVALQVGNYSTTIPAGSFELKSNGSFMFVGTINGVSMSAKITPQGGNNYTFQFTCTGANLTGTVNPASVTLTIGDDTGTISVIF